MQLEEILNAAGAPELAEFLKPRWAESMASFPEGGPDFLCPARIRASLQWCGLEESLAPILEGVAASVRARAGLPELAWHYFRALCDYHEDHAPVRFVPLEKMLGENAPAFYLLVTLALAPRMRACHLRLGVPESVTRETCRQVGCFYDNYRRAHAGKPGIFPGQFDWLKNYVNGSLYFRLGRFEYWSQPSPSDYKVYRHRADGRTLVLAGPAWRINDSGWLEGIGPGAEEACCRQTSLRQVPGGIYGFPINPKGFVEPEAVFLPEREWECVFEKGAPALYMHIPAGGGMTLETCAASLREASDFFSRYFPAPAPRAVICCSWMFSPILERILPESSNLAAFMRELYLLPSNWRGNDSLWFVFLQKPLDPTTAPRETSLQRAILDYLQAGNTWRAGSMLFMLDDLEHFGGQWYRSSYSIADLSSSKR